MEAQAATHDIESPPEEQSQEGMEASQRQVRQVTFQLPAETADAGSPAVLERNTQRGDTIRSGASPWRYPKADDKMPVYVERSFRVKTFGLVSFQQMVCFGIMVLMHIFISSEEATGQFRLKKSTALEVMYYALSLVDMLCIMQLWIVRNSFPTNYFVLLAVTLLSGFLWGLTETVLMTKMHLQLMACTSIVFAVAALASFMLTRDKPWCFKDKIVPVALSIGWTVGTVIVVTVSELYHVGRVWEPLLACAFVLLLLVLLLFETRQTLLSSNTDDFMMCIVILNASMLCLVSIPFFVILYGFLYVHRDEVAEHEDVERPPDRVPDTVMVPYAA